MGELIPGYDDTVLVRSNAEVGIRFRCVGGGGGGIGDHEDAGQSEGHAGSVAEGDWFQHLLVPFLSNVANQPTLAVPMNDYYQVVV